MTEDEMWERLQATEAQMERLAARNVEWKRRFSIVANRYTALKEHLSEAVKLAQQEEPFEVRSYGEEIVWDDEVSQTKSRDRLR